MIEKRDTVEDDYDLSKYSYKIQGLRSDANDMMVQATGTRKAIRSSVDEELGRKIRLNRRASQDYE